MEDLCGIRCIHLGRVEQARAQALAARECNRLAVLFKTMGDCSRLRILHAIEGGEMCVCDLALFLGVSESAVSHQLRQLRQLQLVSARREGQVLYYRLEARYVTQLLHLARKDIRE